MKKKELSDRFKWCLPVICQYMSFGKSQRQISKELGIDKNQLNKITKSKEFEKEMGALRKKFFEDDLKVFKGAFSGMIKKAIINSENKPVKPEVLFRFFADIYMHNLKNAPQKTEEEVGEVNQVLKERFKEYINELRDRKNR